MINWALKVVGRVLARRLANEGLRAAFREAELQRRLAAEGHARVIRDAERAHAVGVLTGRWEPRGVWPDPVAASVPSPAPAPVSADDRRLIELPAPSAVSNVDTDMGEKS